MVSPLLHLLNGGHALIFICLFLFIEEAGIPFPVPGDAVLIAGGYLADTGGVSLPMILVLGYGSAITGAAVCYLLSRKLGRAFLVRHGRFVCVTPKRLARAERWMTRWGGKAVGIARLVPGTRINASIAAGCLRLSFRRFYTGVLVSTMVWIAGFVLLGDVLGSRITPLLPLLDKFMLVVVVGLLMMAFAYWANGRRRQLAGAPSV